jgi:predicted PurR-regulated permease PerM
MCPDCVQPTLQPAFVDIASGSCLHVVVSALKRLDEVGTDLGLDTPPMASRVAASAASPIAIWILVALAMLWFLRAARTVLIPIALAVLISYPLEPSVTWLERRYVHRVLGSAAVLLLVLGGIAAGAYALRDDAVRLVQVLPKAADRARNVVTSQLGSGVDTLGQVTGALGDDSSSSAGNGGERTSTRTSGQSTARSWREPSARSSPLLAI